MEASAIVREKRFQVKPFSKIEMHDPCYGSQEEMSKGATNICAFCKLPVSNRLAEVLLREVRGTFDFDGKEVPYTTFDVRFFSYRKDVEMGRKEVEAECAGRYYPTLIKETKDLGCDTARFILCVDDNELEIKTGADGFYGKMTKYKSNYAYFFEFSLDADVTDWDTLEKTIKYLFQVKEEYDICEADLSCEKKFTLRR